jgi:AcrR family transcriptional regulator
MTARFVPPAPPKTQKAAATRERVLEVASELFVDRGYGAVSMRDVASAADVTKGAIYGHFRSKGQLLVEVIRWKLAAREHARCFVEKLDDPVRRVSLMYDNAGRDVRLLEVDAAAAARHDPDVEAGLAELYGQRQARIRAALADTRDPEMTAWLISVLSAGIAMKHATALPLPGQQRIQATILASLRALT